MIAPTRTLEGGNEHPGILSVFSEPPELEVTLDGTEIGKAPLFSKVVEPCAHVVWIKDSKTKIFAIPGKPFRLTWFKSTFIEIPAEPSKVHQQQKTEDLKIPNKRRTEQLAEKKKFHPLHWLFDRRGSIF